MNFLAWILAISTLAGVLYQSVAFHRATICRQRAWRKSTELLTRTLMTEVKPYEKEWDLGCRLYLTRNQDQIFWTRLPSMKRHEFIITLTGKL